MQISIAGNIGAGKTTLTQCLSKHFRWEAHYESVDNNPYLDAFYHDMKQWAFHLQVYFLSSRFEQIKLIQGRKKNIIQDRTIYEDAYIFAANLNDMGLLDSRDYHTYSHLFELMKSFIHPPGLLIYLRASVSTLIEQINKRAREYENRISENYLSRLNDHYEKWIENYKQGSLLIFDIDSLNFVEKKEDLNIIFQETEKKIRSLTK